MVETQPISFPNWKAALRAAGLTPGVADGFEREIITFLRACKQRHAAVTVRWIKVYLAGLEGPAADRAREALRWFVRAARRAPAGPAPSGGTPLSLAPSRRLAVPLPAQADLRR
jgi:hypothetical protein